MIVRTFFALGSLCDTMKKIIAISFLMLLMVVPAKAQMADAVYKLRAKAVYTQLAGLTNQANQSISNITTLTNEMKLLSHDARFSNLYSSINGSLISYDLFQELPKALKPLLSDALFFDFRNQFVLFYAATFEFDTDALGTAGFWVALTNEELRDKSFSRQIMKANHNSLCAETYGPVRTVPVICHMSVARDTFEAIGGPVAALFWARRAAETAETHNIKDPEVLGDVWKNLVRLERSHGSYEQAKLFAVRFNTLKRENPVDPNWLNGRVFSNGFVHPLLGDFLLLDGQERKLPDLSRSFLANSQSISWVDRARLVRGFQKNKIAPALRKQLEKALLANPAGYTTPFQRSKRRFSRNQKLDFLQLTLGPSPCHGDDLKFLHEKNATRKLRLAADCLEQKIDEIWNFGSEDSFMRDVYEVADILGILGYRKAAQTYYQASLIALSKDKRLEKVRFPQSLDDALAHIAAHSSEVRRHIRAKNLKGALSSLEAIAVAADSAIAEVSGNEPGNISKLVPLLRPSIRVILDLLNDVSTLAGKKASKRVVAIAFRLLQLSQFNEVNLAQQAGLRKAAAENVGGSSALARFDKASSQLKNLRKLSDMHFSMRNGVDRALKAAIAELEASKIALAEKLPLVSTFSNHSSLSVLEVQQALSGDEILILATSGHTTTNFVAITKEKATFTSAVSGNEQLRELVGKLRKSVDPTLPEFDKNIPFDSSVSEEIYISTIGSLAGIMNGKPNVYVVSSGIMASIPWQVLAKPRANPVSRIEWLARDFSFFLSPSIRTLIYGKNNNENKTNQGLSMIGFGDPKYGKVEEYLTLSSQQIAQEQLLNVETQTARLLRSAIAPLPETRDEIEAVLKIGHYAGSLRNRVDLQHTHRQFVLLADLQAMTDNADNPERVSSNVLEVTADYLAVGIDPEQTVICVQSLLPALAELTFLYMNYITVARLERNPTIKDEIQSRGFGRDIPAGFMCYPVSQAADITAFKATVVPVGDDQAPLIEQTNEIVRRLNRLTGKAILPEASALMSGVSRLPGIDGKAKMSKSLGNAIPLSATPEEISASVRGMFTDPNHIRVSDPGKVEGNVVFTYLDAFDPDIEAVEDLKDQYRKGGLADTVVKNRLDRVLQELLRPIRQRRREVINDRHYLKEVLYAGTENARKVTQSTLDELREAMGMFNIASLELG